MINLDWANERQPQGHTLEQIERAREQQTQAAQTAHQHAVTDATRLRAEAQQLISVLGTGPSCGALQQALGWLDQATDLPHIAGAVAALRTAIDWASRDAALVTDMRRGQAPALAQQAAQRAAEERRPKVLTVEERLDRIEKQLGLE